MKTDQEIKHVLFRCSKVGLIVGGLIRHGLTQNQKDEKQKLETLAETPIGLSEKQQSDLDKWNEKIEQGGTLTPSQMEKRADYTERLIKKRELTPNQKKTLADYTERESRPPELSKGAKTHIKEVWLEYEKGFYEDITDKKLRKGIQAEEDAISLISEVDGKMYFKNTDRKTKGHLTGECDVVENATVTLDPAAKLTAKLRIIHDTKCSWNPYTFMKADLTPIYEWQGRAYMYLYDADLFKLRYCLVDCPPEVYADEYQRYCFTHGIIDDSLPQYAELIEQFERNFLYSNSPLYNKAERVKTFTVTRDRNLENILVLSLQLAVEYYKTISLNMIEDE